MRWNRFILHIVGVFLAAVSSALADHRTPAALHRSAVMLAAPSKVFYQAHGEELPPDLIASYHQFSHEQSFDFADVIPVGLSPGEEDQIVMRKFLDRSAKLLYRSDFVQGTRFGAGAKTVEKSMKSEVSFASEPNSIQHKLNFFLNAFSGQARVQYEGLAQAQLIYAAEQGRVNLEMSEKLDQTLVVLSQTLGTASSESSIQMRWDF